MRLCFVVPWYGPEANGGAETACRQTAEHLAAAGLPVEILTTCSRSFLSRWDRDYFKPGTSECSWVVVRRFRCQRRNVRRFDDINRRLLRGERITATEEAQFFAHMINSPGLVRHVSATKHDSVFLLIPYLYGTTVQAALAAPERSILLPCLHDEPYAFMAPVREMFQRVRGVGFLSNAERSLAERFYQLPAGRSRLLGLGVDPGVGDAARFKQRHGDFPFVLSVGRKAAEKGTLWLVDAFKRYKARNGGPLRLVLAGPGEVDLGAAGPEVLDLGFLSPQEKWDAYAAATVFCNPSRNESFSIVLMEAWLAGIPALVPAGCAVTCGHVRSAQGGLYYLDGAEFAASLDLLLARAELRQRLGENGRRYVTANFTWPAVVRRYLDALEHWGLAEHATGTAS